jgi:cobalt-zinc-cadmium efflux system membrane fusion protein
MQRFVLFAAGLALGAAVAFGGVWLRAPAQPPSVAKAEAPIDRSRQGPRRIVLDDSQLETAGIVVAPAQGGEMQRHFLAAGSLVPDADLIGRVSVRVVATVSELRKRLGDSVERNEIVAVIESREIAEAKSGYLAARITNELQQTLYERSRSLSRDKVISENDFLRAQLAASEAQIRLDSARQKLFALGVSEAEIAELPSQPPEKLRQQYLRAPIAGRVSERRVDVGGLIGREGQESELFVIVNLDKVWVDLAVAPEDIVHVREGLPVKIRGIGIETEATANVIFVSPLLERDTRNARVIAELPNTGHRWRPGTFVTAEVPLPHARAALLLPKAAIQTIASQPHVFVRTQDSFELRQVRLGHEDDESVEILGGLQAGEVVAVQNTFTLKAQAEKGEAAHD